MTMSEVKYIADNLLDDYVPVFHEQLAKLYSQYKPEPPEQGTYDTDFDYADQTLANNSVKTVLGPAFTMYRDAQCAKATMTMATLGADLVIADPDGGCRWEMARLSLNSERAASFSEGYTAEVTVAGSTIESVRDGTIAEGLAVGMNTSGGSTDPLLCFAALRRPEGEDVFDVIFPDSDMQEQVGYYAIWKVLSSEHTLYAFRPITAGSLEDVTFKVVVDSGKTAAFYVNDVPLVEAVNLGGTCMDTVGIVAQQWGLTTGNPPFSGVIIKHFAASGLAMPSGPGNPASSAGTARRDSSTRPRADGASQ